MIVGIGLVLRGQKSDTVNVIDWECSRNICYAKTLRKNYATSVLGYMHTNLVYPVHITFLSLGCFGNRSTWRKSIRRIFCSARTFLLWGDIPTEPYILMLSDAITSPLERGERALTRSRILCHTLLTGYVKCLSDNR